MNKYGVLVVLVLTAIVGFGFCGIVHADLNDGLVAYYPFDGNANDASGNGNHGTVHGAILTEDRFGNQTHAYHFNGTDNYIDIGNNPSLKMTDGISISVWIKMVSIPSDDYYNIISDHSTNEISVGCGKILRFDQGSLQFVVGGIYGYGTGIYVEYEFSDTLLGKWQHIVATYNKHVIKLYFNATEVSSKQYSTPLTVNSNPLLIGKSGFGEYFYGDIDDIRIYNRALSESEILQLYNENECLECPNDGFTQDDIDNAVNTAIQACVNDPSSCGISVDGGGYTQADLDAKYQEGYNAGCTACSDGTAMPATISPELKMHIPVLQYVSPFGSMDLWADFEFAGESNGDMLWKLSDFGQN